MLVLCLKNMSNLEVIRIYTQLECVGPILFILLAVTFTNYMFSKITFSTIFSQWVIFIIKPFPCCVNFRTNLIEDTQSLHRTDRLAFLSKEASHCYSASLYISYTCQSFAWYIRPFTLCVLFIWLLLSHLGTTFLNATTLCCATPQISQDTRLYHRNNSLYSLTFVNLIALSCAYYRLSTFVLYP